MKIKSYELLVSTFYVLFFISLYLMYINNDLLWLALMPITSWANHFIFSLNHRMIAHKAFTAKNKFIHNSIIALNVFQVSHSPLRFAILHRHHHGHADVPGKDVHGPTMGFWESVFGWEYNADKTIKRLNIKLPKDLLRDNFLMWFDKNYFAILFAVFLIVHLISWKAFWYVIVPGSVFFRLSASYFSNYHTSYFGYKNYDLGNDTAKNSFLSNIFTCGEGWHNNHHSQPGAWNFSRKWWEWDPPAFAIKHLLGTNLKT